MFKSLTFFLVTATCLATATPFDHPETRDNESILGIVDPVRRCGGLGTFRQLRISECDGRCALFPGQVYECELDFMPSMAAPQLTLKIEICMGGGFCMLLIDTDLPNSSVQPGFVYSVKYSIVPNDILAGQSVAFIAYIIHTDDQHLDVCITADVDIMEL